MKFSLVQLPFLSLAPVLLPSLASVTFHAVSRAIWTVFDLEIVFVPWIDFDLAYGRVFDLVSAIEISFDPFCVFDHGRVTLSGISTDGPF